LKIWTLKTPINQVGLGFSISILALQWHSTATAANCKQWSHHWDLRTRKAKPFSQSVTP